jgi:integrase
VAGGGSKSGSVKNAQRAKRLTPRWYRSARKWVVDLPEDMNAGHRCRKNFTSQAEAMKWVSDRMRAHTLGKIKERVKRTPQEGKLSGLAQIYCAEKKAELGNQDGFRQIKYSLGLLCKNLGNLAPEDLTPETIENWWRGLKHGERTVFNAFVQARQFYGWRGIRETVKENPFLLAKVPPKKKKGARLAILTPDQMKTLLKADLKPWIKARIVLGGFAGLRMVEIERMSYESVDTEYKEINVRLEESKQGEAMRPRSITLQDALWRHLPKGEGKFFAGVKDWMWLEEMPKVCKLIGVEEWPQNCLRHSFASYHLAHFRDSVKTAFEMGHASPRLLYETYGNAVSRRDAAAWWEL